MDLKGIIWKFQQIEFYHYRKGDWLWGGILMIIASYLKRMEILYDPTAEEIFLLNKGENVGHLMKVEPIPRDELGIRFAKLGGEIRIEISFDSERNVILLKVSAVRGEKYTQVLYLNEELQDSVIIEGTWYSLLNNYEETKQLLKVSDIRNSGIISLSQYISLKKQLLNFEKIVIIDTAEQALANHPYRFNALPVALKAKLYPYQRQGYLWMRFITEENCGCILGDEMGLGKRFR